MLDTNKAAIYCHITLPYGKRLLFKLFENRERKAQSHKNYQQRCQSAERNLKKIISSDGRAQSQKRKSERWERKAQSDIISHDTCAAQGAITKELLHADPARSAQSQHKYRKKA